MTTFIIAAVGVGIVVELYAICLALGRIAESLQIIAESARKG